MSIPSGFAERHIGPNEARCQEMLQALGCASLEALVDEAVPAKIQLESAIELPDALSEEAALEELRGIMSRNVVLKSCIGQGYY